MFNEISNSFIKMWYNWIDFLHFARKHRIKINPKDWFKGVACLLLGWGLIAIDSVTFKEPLNSAVININFLVQFTTGIVLIVLGSFFYKIIKPHKLGVYEFLKISHRNELSGSAILVPKIRRVLIFSRGFIGAGGYIGFQLARMAVGTIDNAIIYGADSLMYVILAIILLKERYNLHEWIGIIIMILGISIIVYFDLMDMNRVLAIKGCLLGVCSSFSLAIILILTSVIVQHDHPVRVVFYQCFCGFLISLFFTLVYINEIQSLINLKFNVVFAITEGLLYAIAVICFLQAFYYVDPIIVAISSYSLDLYSVLFDAIINKELISVQATISTTLIALGSGFLILTEYKNYRKKYKIKK